MHSLPTHYSAYLAEALGIPVSKRRLHFGIKSSQTRPRGTASLQGRIEETLYGPPSLTVPAWNGHTPTWRTITPTPERVLDAPGLIDDFYLNPLSISPKNIVAVALGQMIYTFMTVSGRAAKLGSCPDRTYISSVNWSANDDILAVGLGDGSVEIWDAYSATKLRTMRGHQGRIAALSWSVHIVSSGCKDGSIWHHDVRMPQHKVQVSSGHTGEVCGLRWRGDGELLASGGEDNLVNLWDARKSGVTLQSLVDTRLTIRDHVAGVKALAWAPWDSRLLASGGGTLDANINVWTVTTGARVQNVHTPAQITSLTWSLYSKEILSTHGYPTNSLMIHSFPSMGVVGEISEAHESRLLYSDMAPAGDIVVTGAADDSLKFWRIWDVPGERSGRRARDLVSQFTIR
ncbi:WD40 repeat-like protein [Auricularia subglabra TFB-10046 SS5]|nr:WD40 repeat-like protein [Auricularia subglabra TFB-10046 SS5]